MRAANFRLRQDVYEEVLRGRARRKREARRLQASVFARAPHAWSGTSMATPHVTAAVALMLARDPKRTPAEIAARLAQSARKVARMRSATLSKAYGYGLLDLPAALA